VPQLIQLESVAGIGFSDIRRERRQVGFSDPELRGT
jgi:hypothetical protein